MSTAAVRPNMMSKVASMTAMLMAQMGNGTTLGGLNNQVVRVPERQEYVTRERPHSFTRGRGDGKTKRKANLHHCKRKAKVARRRA